MKLPQRLVKAAEDSKDGILTLEIAHSLRLAGKDTVKTTLSRLAKSGGLLRLKRGVYCTNPVRDAFAAAQATFNGYVGFGCALYIHGMLAEIPFTVTVVARGTSAARNLGEYEFVSVAMKEKAIGFERKGRYVVSTRAKTLFDCAYLPRCAPEMEKLAEAYCQHPLNRREWWEFDFYCQKFAAGNSARRAAQIKARILKGCRHDS